jgi:CRP-like cAMP-binding protein
MGLARLPRAFPSVPNPADEEQLRFPEEAGNDTMQPRLPMTVRNRLLRELPAADRDAILAKAELVPMQIGSILQEPMVPPTHAYFPEDGLGSTVAVMDDGSMVEAASVGLDGFIGMPLALGIPASSARVIWQVPGSAYRIEAGAFQELIRDGRFHTVLAIYLQQIADQMTQVAGCNRRHSIARRAARWLVMTHDRVEGDRFTLTQEFLAAMLGAGRPKVTVAAQELQRAGLITYQRGVVTVTDREGLERAACECYAVLAKAFPGGEIAARARMPVGAV